MRDFRLDVQCVVLLATRRIPPSFVAKTPSSHSGTRECAASWMPYRCLSDISRDLLLVILFLKSPHFKIVGSRPSSDA
jgi:hypothetical protein